MREVLEAFLSELRSGRRATLATIVKATGSTPRTVGARMLVREDGSIVGTIGGGAFEAMVIAHARDLVGSDRPEPAVRRYAFTEEGADALGMACGGSAEVLIEVAIPGPPLVVVGAGHVGLALARLAASVGFDVVVVDDRPDAIEAARRAGCGRVALCGSEYASGLPAIGAEAYVAVVTRCHRTDRGALAQVLRSPARYVGLIGSRRKRSVIFQQLLEQDGVDAAALERVRCPIGLPLGGDTPQEIAVSIVAELLQVRNTAR